MKRLAMVLMVAGIALLLHSVAFAASAGSVSFDGTGFSGAATCDDADLDYSMTMTADTDDGGGVDWIAFVMVDGDGAPLDVDFWDFALGPVSFTDFTDFGLIYSVGARPVTIKLYDITDPGAIEENSVAGFDFASTGTLLAQDTIDPATIVPACAGLPLRAGGGSCLPLTDVAVVGDVPLGAQTYYAPGQVASGVVLNPGTYWILGQDESHQFYKILLACQYLWIPVDTAQPSFQPPWQGQPLPTEVVD